VKVDVETAIEIDRPRGDVARYAGDPANATRWYANIKTSAVLTPAPLTVGTRIAFTARFLGRQLAYTYEVEEYIPDERLVMRTADGPFAMETTYEWRDAGPHRTRMTLRNRGSPSGFVSVMAPAMEAAMRRANRKDLERLRSILETESIETRA